MNELIEETVGNVGSKGNKVSLSLINYALEELVSKNDLLNKRNYDARIRLLCKSLLQLKDTCRKIFGTMLSKGVPITEIFEQYMPDTARQLGEYWVKNVLSFAEVTIAISRLQNVAQELEKLYVKCCKRRSLTGGELLVIVPERESHTLGAQMICRKFRRLGAEPYLAINNSVAELEKIIATQSFDLIGLSLSDQNLCKASDNAKNIRKIVKSSNLPLVVGGSLTDTNKGFCKDIFSVLKPDLVTSDAYQTLHYFGLIPSHTREAQ